MSSDILDLQNFISHLNMNKNKLYFFPNLSYIKILIQFPHESIVWSKFPSCCSHLYIPVEIELYVSSLLALSLGFINGFSYLNLPSFCIYP